MLTRTEQGLLDAFEAAADGRGIEIVTVEVIGSKKSPVVRVYIDAEGGVSFPELSDAQEWIGDLLDKLDPFPGAYTLEVSSPGIDRPLRTPHHFARFCGEEVKVRTLTPIEERNSFRGTLVQASDDGIDIMSDGKRVAIPYTAIKRANVIGKVEF